MKISKLFHWLYAILMLLPIGIWIPTAFYYGFNKEATNGNSTIVYEPIYETNVVESSDDLISGNAYLISNVSTASSSYNAIVCTEVWLYRNDTRYKIDVSMESTYYLMIRFSSSLGMTITSSNDGTYVYVPGDYMDKNKVVVVYNSGYVNTGNYTISECPSELIPVEPRLINNATIVDSMTHSFNSVFDLPLFEWSKDSFLVTPFNYITDLFGFSDNAIVYALDYWLSISIIWLVFDLVMYVPLLVHRWIDKGVYE